MSRRHIHKPKHQPHKPILDLVARFVDEPGRIALLGLRLGDHFAARAAGHETRLTTVMASTPFPNPARMFALSVQAAIASAAQATWPPSAAAQRSHQVTLWKAGARSPHEFLARSATMVADPARVTVPFLPILGDGDSLVFAAQAREWHRYRSARKAFVLLDPSTGADGHCQVNNRLRLAQECCGWMDEVFAA